MDTTNEFPGFNAIELASGNHKTRGPSLCIMEVVAWAHGETHSDEPKCVCPVIAAMCRRLNDARGMTPALRRELFAPLFLKLAGTRGDESVMRRRAFMAADFAVREAAPVAMDAVKLPEHAAALRACAPIVDAETARAAREVARKARQAAAAAADAAAAAAAAAAAYAAAYAAAAAAAAADAAAAAAAYAAAYAARIDLYRKCAALIGRMCEITS